MASKNTSLQFIIAITLSVLIWVVYLLLNQNGWIARSSVADHFSSVVLDTGYSNEKSVSNTPSKTPRPSPSKASTVTPIQKQAKDTVQINTADSIEWNKLFGIGPFRAGRILNFRNALGGFVSVDQVNETYGLPDSIFQDIKPQLVLINKNIKYIKINSAKYDSLYLHPYITKQMAYFILKHRRENGRIQNFNDLKKIILEKDHQRLEKVKPYLDFSIYKD